MSLKDKNKEQSKTNKIEKILNTLEKLGFINEKEYNLDYYTIKQFVETITTFRDQVKNITKKDFSKTILENYNKEYPIKVYTQKIGSDGKLRNLKIDDIKNFSVPFVKYNKRNNSWYLVYHFFGVEIDKEDLDKLNKGQISEKEIKEKYIKGLHNLFGNTNTEINTDNLEIFKNPEDKKTYLVINTISDNVKKLIKESLDNILDFDGKEIPENVISLENYETTNNESKPKVYLDELKDLLSKGFHFVPLLPRVNMLISSTINFVEYTQPIALVPDDIVKIPTLYSSEIETLFNQPIYDIENSYSVNLREIRDIFRLVSQKFENEDYSYLSEINPIIKNGEKVYYDSSLDYDRGLEYVIGGHLLSNLILKGSEFIKTIKNLEFINDYDMVNDPIENYGFHISVSIPNIIEAKDLYNYLYTYGLVYDGLFRHINRITQNINLSKNSFLEFDERGIFRYIEGVDKDYITYLLQPKISEIFAEYLHLESNKLNEIKHKIFGNNEKIDKNLYINKRLQNYFYIFNTNLNRNLLELQNPNIENIQNIPNESKKSTFLYLEKLLKTNTNEIESVLNNIDVIDEYIESINVSKYKDVDFEKYKKDMVVNLLRLVKDNIQREFMLDILRKLKNNLDIYYRFINSDNPEEQPSPEHKKYLLFELTEHVFNMIKSLKDDPFEFLNNVMETENQEIINIFHLTDIVDKVVDYIIYKEIFKGDINNFKKIFEPYFNQITDNILKEIKTLLKKSNNNLTGLNRLEIRFPATIYEPSYFINNLLMVGKMVKDISILTLPNVKESLKFTSHINPSNWTIYEKIREETKEKISKSKQLRKFLIKEVLGIKKRNEIELFESLVKYTCRNY